MSVLPNSVFLAGALVFWAYGRLARLQVVTQWTHCRPVHVIAPINKIDWTSLKSPSKNGAQIRLLPERSHVQ